MAMVYFTTNRTLTGRAQEPFGIEAAAGNPPPVWCGFGNVVRRYDRGDECYEVDGSVRIESAATPDAPHLLSSAFIDDLKKSRPGVRHVIVFIHGFANAFRTAFHRVAELRDNYFASIAANAANQPLLFVFSWPSDGFVMPADEYYSSDRRDALTSGAALAAALKALHGTLTTQTPPGTTLKVHLVAHSMGNYALSSALQKLALLMPDGLPANLFENTFLMAADEDYDALEPQGALRSVCGMSKEVRIYHSSADVALEISQTRMGNPQRLGWKGPRAFSKVPNNVTLVDCSNVSDTPSIVHGWHQYYRQRQEVYEDVAAVIAGTAPAAIEHRTTLGARRFKIKRRFYLGPDMGIANV